MPSFDILKPSAAARLPVIVHVPHGSTSVPAAYRADFAVSDEELDAEVLRMTDHYTEDLAAGATALGMTVFVNRVSRLVMDPERFADDADEPMAQRGMGAVYVSRADGRALRRESFGANDRLRLMSALYAPYHAAVEELVSEMLEEFGRCLLVDLHSFPLVALPYEDASLARPEICIGFDDAHVDEPLRELWAAHLRGEGIDVGFNTPFAGSLVPTRFYRRDPRVRSMMVEVRRDQYMDEATGARSAGFPKAVALVTKLLEHAASVTAGHDSSS